jgi:hypothetical protein
MPGESSQKNKNGKHPTKTRKWTPRKTGRKKSVKNKRVKKKEAQQGDVKKRLEALMVLEFR